MGFWTKLEEKLSSLFVAVYICDQVQGRALNRVVDTLSRKHNLLPNMRVTVTSFDTFLDLYATDPFLSTVLTKLQGGDWVDYISHEGFLFQGLQLCIPDCNLLLKIIQELHSVGHVGHDRTLPLVSTSYFWLIMHNEVGKFVDLYCVCQLAKGKVTNVGLYMLHPIPT